MPRKREQGKISDIKKISSFQITCQALLLVTKIVLCVNGLQHIVLAL